VRSVSPTENPEIFIALHFLIYNVSDWFGRYVCSYPWAQIWSEKKLMALCVARMAFIVLFLLCNVNLGPSVPVPNLSSHTDPRSFAQAPLEALSLPISYDGRQWPPRSPGDIPFINSDIIFFMLVSSFGFSNGWLTSLLMMAAPSLEHNQRMKREWVDLAAVGANFRYAFCFLGWLDIGLKPFAVLLQALLSGP
jgi:equilibrative nucleoside transporter 1/2/3